MIGRIAGQVVYRADDHVLIDVAGVGYLVHCSDRTLGGLPPAGEGVALFTELLVKEDLLHLTGFPTLAEKEWFRLLTGVQGVGAKAALAILGTLGLDGVARAVALGDAAAIKAAPGVGPKLAQRVVNELKGKSPAALPDAAGGAKPPAKPVDPQAATDMAAASAVAEALSALANLGYASGDAAAAVASAQQQTPEADTSGLIRGALKRLAPAG